MVYILLFIKHSVKLEFSPSLLMADFQEREPHFHSILELRIPFNSKNGSKHEEKAQFLLQNRARLNENRHSSLFQESILGINRF